MPRKSNVKKPDVRSYGTLSNYSSKMLEGALEKIKSGALTQRQAAKFFKIPRSTLYNKLKMKHNKSVGRPTSLTMEEEIIFRDHLLALSDFGIPVGLNDFKVLVKRYLNSINKTVPVFTNNIPGYEWGKLYLERHPALKEKIAQNISRKRAQVNEEMINQFFDLLTSETNGVAPENIYNMDESGFHDNPGKQKLIFRRTNRHPEMIRTSTKSCYTVVFCGNAIGEFIPPFFIFKGKHCWSDWLQNAPKFSKMTVSKSGWIDTEIFEEWLEKHFIPIVDKQEGKKILLCDNLSAHISVKALKLCEEHNIKFICLIPNSTHLLQPLDVGYFSSLKSAWRSVLRKWRQTQRGRKVISLPKNIFAQLLKLALDQCESTAGLNLMTGFRKCGLHPLSRREILQILPGYAATDVQMSVGETFKEYLKDIRQSDLNIKSCKKFQLPVDAGKAVSAEQVALFYKNKEDEQTKKKEKPAKRGRPVGSKNLKAKLNKRAKKGDYKSDDVSALSIKININSNEENQSIAELDSSILKNTVTVPETVELNTDKSTVQNHLSILECMEMDKENCYNKENVMHIELEEPRAASPDSDTAEIPIISTVVVSVHTAPKERSLHSPGKKPKTVLEENWKAVNDLYQIDKLQEDEDGEIRKLSYEPEAQLYDFTNESEKTDLIGFENITGDFLVHPDGGKLVQINEQVEVFKINKFCVFNDKGTLYPGRITNISENASIMHVSCLNKNLEGGWIWPDKPDLITITDFTMIIKVLRDDKISKRGKTIYINDDFLSMEWGE